MHNVHIWEKEGSLEVTQLHLYVPSCQTLENIEDTTYPGLWAVDWTMDRTLDSMTGGGDRRQKYD